MVSLRKNIAVSDSGFVFNPSTGDSFSLNPIGQEIFQLLKDGKTDTQIHEHICKNYQVDKDTIEKDLYDFMKMLGQYKLLDLV